MSAQRTPRAMTFTGCWTCKARKVRCDERPNTCRNCEKRGIPCGGYGIRLHWMSDPFAEAPRLQGRRSMKLDQTSHVYDSDKIDELLSIIDRNAECRLSSSHGPFSAFSTRNNFTQVNTPARSESSPSASISPELEFLADSERQEQSTTDGIASPLVQPVDHNQDFDSISLPFEYTHSLSPFFIENESIPMQTNLIDDLSPVEGLAGGFLVERPSLDQDNEETSATDTALTLFQRSSLVPQIINTSLFRDPEIASLMNHYNIHVAGLLVPVHHSDNPYRHLYLSTAIKGILNRDSYTRSSRDIAYTALCQSLLASAAFHRWKCNQHHIKYRELGAKYRYYAIQSLKSALNINERAPVANYQVLMITMLSLVTIGVLSGEGEDFRVHIEAASQLRKSRSRWEIISRSSKQLNEIGAFLALLSRTTSFQPSAIPWTCKDRLVAAEDMIIQSSGCYEHVYGITPTIAAAINQTCYLAAHLARLRQNKEDNIPDGILEACEEVGDKLQSWRFEHENITLIPSSNKLGILLLKHQANAWHAAALIYYCTRIQGTEPVDLVQETDHVIQHLRATEDVKSGIIQPGESLAPITWPGFIASCVALKSRRDIWREWWEKMMSYNIGNISKQWEIIQQVWERLDQAEKQGTSIDWMKAYQNVGRHVLPT